MKLAYPNMKEVIHIPDGFAFGLVIENPDFMYRFLKDLAGQCRGEPGEAILSVNNSPVSIQKYLELMTDFVNFDDVPKRALTKFLQSMERVAQSAEFVCETNEIMAGLEGFLNKLAFEEDVNLAYDKFSLTNLLKAVGIRPIMEYNSLGERLYAYMDFVTRYEGEKLFAAVNLRSFLSDKDAEILLNVAILRGMKILLIDNESHPILPMEKRLLIDEDLCEM